MTNKTLNLIFLMIIALAFFNCSSDDDEDDDCPENMIVDINDPESIARAEACGLDPAVPVGLLNSDNTANFFIYE